MAEYDSDIAAHYAAFRPALHDVILKVALGEAQFAHGLDLGCGTGRSSVALAAWCNRVTGTDASAAMLAAAEEHPGVHYRALEDGRWPIAESSVDVVTFAGVLPYLDRTQTVAALRRVCQPGAVVISYDFAVELGPVITALGLDGRDMGYDHAANFAGCAGVHVEASKQWVVDLDATADQVAHLVLAGRRGHEMLVNRFGREGLFEAVRDRVPNEALQASLYFTRHALE